MTEQDPFEAALVGYDATLNPADSCPCSNCHRSALRAVWDEAVAHGRELAANEIEDELGRDEYGCMACGVSASMVAGIARGRKS